MAKVKAAATPTKAKAASKSKTQPPASTAPEEPRRSPRKPVQSAKKLGSDILAVPSKVAKRVSTTKSASAKKTISPAKVVKGATKSSVKRAQSPADSKASPKKQVIDTSPPKPRGRPRKEREVEVAVVTPTPPKRRPLFLRGGPPKAEQTVEVPQSNEEIWTDSPKKRKTPVKRKPKVSQGNGGSPSKALDIPQNDAHEYAKIRQASIGGVRKSIEVAGRRRESRSRSKSPGPGTVATKSRSLSKSPARGRSGSVSSKPPSKQPKQRSKSPAKTASKALSRSPSRKPASRTSISRSKSPAKAAAPRKTYRASSGPSKRDETGNSQSSKLCSASSSPNIGSSEDPIVVDKTRRSRSPAKSKAQSSGISRTASPSKTIWKPSRTRSQSPAKPSQSPSQARSQSPAKPARSPVRRSSAEATFEERFNEKSEYGVALRKIERDEYKFTKGGGGDRGHSDAVSKEHEQRATLRGIQRAELEMGLNKGASTKGRRASPARTKPRAADRRRSSFYEMHRDEAAKHRPDVLAIEDDAERVEERDASIRRSSSPCKPSRSASPRTKLSRSASPGSDRPKAAKAADERLPPDQPSAPGRGTVRSATSPEYIPGTKNKNPFFETLPGPQVWHRRMPPYFPFGETPFMEQVMSRQINGDLEAGKKKASEDSAGILGRATSAVKSGFNAIGQSFWGRSPPQEAPTGSPWELPEVTDAEVASVLRQIQKTHEGGMENKKRRASGASASGFPKRARRRSSEYLMSGAL